jgi:hypothetical protein
MSSAGGLDRLKRPLGPLIGPGLLLFAIWRIGDLANLVSKLFLGRFLPQLDFGAVEPTVSAMSLLALPIGIIYRISTKSMSRLLALGKEAECAGLVRDLHLAACGGALLSAAAVLLMRDYILARLHLEGGAYAWLLAAAAALAWWQPLGTALIQGARRFGLSAVPSVAGPVLVMLLTLLLVGPLSCGLKGALAARILGTLGATAFVLGRLGGMVRGRRAGYRSEWPHMLRMLAPMVLLSLSSGLLVHFDRLLARNFLLADSGGYGVIVSLGQIPVWLIGPVTFVVFPLVAAEHAGARDTARYYAEALGLGLAITAACVAAMFFGAGAVIRAWNPAYLPYAPCVWIYTAALGFHAVTDILTSAETARSRYAFLWFMLPPALAMAAGLYAARGSLTVVSLVTVVAAVRGAILLAIAGHLGWKYLRRARAASLPFP